MRAGEAARLERSRGGRPIRAARRGAALARHRDPEQRRRRRSCGGRRVRSSRRQSRPRDRPEPRRRSLRRAGAEPHAAVRQPDVQHRRHGRRRRSRELRAARRGRQHPGLEGDRRDDVERVREPRRRARAHRRRRGARPPPQRPWVGREDVRAAEEGHEGVRTRDGAGRGWARHREAARQVVRRPRDCERARRIGSRREEHALPPGPRAVAGGLREGHQGAHRSGRAGADVPHADSRAGPG